MHATDFTITPKAVTVWHDQSDTAGAERLFVGSRMTIRFDAITAVQFEAGPPTAYGKPAILWHVVVSYGAGGQRFTFSDQAKAMNLESRLSGALANGGVGYGS